MLGQYEAKQQGRIRYKGNKLFSPIEDVRKIENKIVALFNQ